MLNNLVMRVHIITLIIYCFFTSSLHASERCDTTIPLYQHTVDGEEYAFSEGSTICLEEGERGPLRLKNIHGSDILPITITNQNGAVITKPYEYSISIENSSYLKLVGSEGTDESPYSIRLGGTLGIGKLSHHITVKGVEIYQARFAGMLIKTDPNCDPATWRENFTMAGVVLKDNYIHHTKKGEGIYIGYTGRSRTLMCDGEEKIVYPHYVEEVLIEGNLIEDIAADGMQVNSIKGQVQISDNTIYRTGVSPFAASWQDAGIQIGGNDVIVSNNIIMRAGGNGMMLDGDDLRVIGNKIMYSGENGIFVRNAAQQSDQVSDGKSHKYIDNVISFSQDYAFKNYAVRTYTPHKIYRNTIEYSGKLDAAGRPMTISYLNNEVFRDERDNRIYVIE